MIGWEHTFIHEITHLLDCIVNDKPVGPTAPPSRTATAPLWSATPWWSRRRRGARWM
jgi:hypothetical protein